MCLEVYLLTWNEFCILCGKRREVWKDLPHMLRMAVPGWYDYGWFFFLLYDDIFNLLAQVFYFALIWAGPQVRDWMWPAAPCSHCGSQAPGPVSGRFPNCSPGDEPPSLLMGQPKKLQWPQLSHPQQSQSPFQMAKLPTCNVWLGGVRGHLGQSGVAARG